MIAALKAGKSTVATLEDNGEWTAANKKIAEILNSLYDPREQIESSCGDHHAGFGAEQARRAAIMLKCKVEYAEREPLPEGSIS